MLFQYKAKSAEGKVREGEMEAHDRLELARMLRKDGFYLIEVHSEVEKGGKAILKRFATLDLRLLLEKIKGASLEEKMIFSRNLAVMTASGVPIIRALEVLQEQTQSPLLRKAIQGVSQSITRGKDLSDALLEYPKIFSTLYVSMVRAGEATGKLEETLNTLSDQLEKQHELRARIRGAMTYPIVIIIVMIAIGILMMVKVVPQLKDTFSDLGVELPFTTRTVIAISDFLKVYWWTIPISVPIILFLFRKGLTTNQGRRIFAWLLLRMPIFKSLVRKINNATFARTLSSLISGGVPILEALAITADVLRNEFFKTSLLAIRDQVKTGESLYVVMRKYPHLYTPLTLEMIEVGEEAGKLADLLVRVAIFYEAEVSDTTKNMSSIIEPVLMVVIGGAVGFFAVSIMQPIYGVLGKM